MTENKIKVLVTAMVTGAPASGWTVCQHLAFAPPSTPLHPAARDDCISGCSCPLASSRFSQRASPAGDREEDEAEDIYSPHFFVQDFPGLAAAVVLLRRPSGPGLFRPCPFLLALRLAPYLYNFVSFF